MIDNGTCSLAELGDEVRRLGGHGSERVMSSRFGRLGVAMEHSRGPPVEAGPNDPRFACAFVLIRYEYPFNEGIRTMLRLEHLFDRLGQLIARDSAVDHHHALATIFEIMDVGARADLKSDLLKELERHRQQLLAFRGNPAIAEAALEDMLGRIDGAFARLNQVAGKAGAALTSNEWLMSIRSRISIPGGTCEFDLPAYYAWQQLDAAAPPRRPAELGFVADAAGRSAAGPARPVARFGPRRLNVVAKGGQYSAEPAARTASIQLMRVRIDPALPPRARDQRPSPDGAGAS